MILHLTLLVMLRGAAMVSVDPDMELPVRSDTEEDIYVFNSMNINPLDVRVNYRGQPHRHPHRPHQDEPERDRAGGDRLLVHKIGPAAPTLSPGAGSWMFNSIESRAKQGLTPTHVPKHGDMSSEASEAVLSVEATSPGSVTYQEEKVTIPPQYKDILNQSEDYKRWLDLKNNFLRKHKKLHLPKNPLKKNKSSKARQRDDKFPNFPGYGAGETEARPPRKSLPTASPSPAVFKEGGTLYRAKTSAPTRTVKPPVKTPVKTPVKVSSLHVTSPRPATYSSPLYPNTPFYSTPQPPLPPGYELVPVDQLTEEHEVVPWEDLPHLMRKHNMSLSQIPLGPFQHSTTAAPFTVFSSAPKYSSTPPTPVPVYTKSVQSFTTSKPFTAFSALPTKFHQHRPPFIPPPVSPELSNSLLYREDTKLHHPVKPIIKTKPKSIHFGTHFGPLPGQASTTAGPLIVSNTFRYNPTTGPSNGLVDHTPSLVSQPTPPPTLGRFSPFPPPTPTPAVRQIASSPKYPVFSTSIKYQTTPQYTPSTIKFHHTPSTSYHHSTPSTIKYSPTPSTIKYHNTPSTIRYSPTPSTVKYHNTPSTIKYKPTPSTRYPGYQSTSELTAALLHYSTLSPQAPSYVSPSSVKSPPSPARPDPPPMPKFLPPPNKQLPTYFDVAVPVPAPTVPPETPSLSPVPIFQLGDNSVETPATTPSPPIVLQGRLKTLPGVGGSPAPHVVLPSNVNKPQSTDVDTRLSHQGAAIKQDDNKQFEHFTQKSSKVSEPQERPSSRLVSLTTLRPELATKHNPNKMRSSTHRNKEDKATRFRPRPLSPNFHPIRPRPTPMSRLVPQIRPKVPGSETESGSEVHDTNTDTAVISNNNNGVWFIQEKMKENGAQVKREFSSAENKTTINPALTEKPRTWPSTLKKSVPRENNIYDDVNVIERGKSGQLEQIGSSRESTTFTTSRVEMSVSTTPSPAQLKKSDSALRDLMMNKAHRLLDSLANKEEKFERMDEMGNIRPAGKRRKKFRVQPKSLSGGEVHTVFPMDREHTENKPVHEIFNSHPGLKRISAYDFERAMAGGPSPLSITKPVAELKVSIEELANTMNQLNRNVLETSTKAEPKEPEDDKITQLQEEIAKLTKTLETLRLSPKAESSKKVQDLMRSTVRSIMSSTGRPIDISSPRIDFQESESVNTWQQSADKNVNDDNGRKVGSGPHMLDIVEVYTRPSPTRGMGLSQSNRVAVVTPRPTPASTAMPTSRATSRQTSRTTSRPQVQVTPVKTETSDDDIINFFGSPTEKFVANEETEHEFFKPKLIEKKMKNDFGSSGSNSQDFNDIISQEATGVLGLFEMMGKINKEATNNFDVVKTVNSNKPQTTQQPRLSFEEMKEKFRLHEVDKIKAQEEELRKQQMEKLKLFNMFQEEEKIQKQKLREEQEKKTKFAPANSFDSLQGWTDDDSWEKTIKSNDDKVDDKGVAYASITIENVDVDDARDYDVNNGIVRLRKDDRQPTGNVEYEYEYYEADPDDIKFPVGGTRQFYESQTMKNINQISNKELLMNLLDASDNFENREFLERLKNIVTGGAGEEREISLTDVAENVLRGTQQGPGMRSHDRWAPAKQLPSSPKTSKLHNGLNDLPVWPSTNNFGSSPSLETFKPITNQLVFPNRRMDEGAGVGEVSLVSGQERGQLTSISQSQPPSHSPYRISDRLDFTSDNEFVVGTSLSMNQGGAFQPQNSKFGQTGGNFNSGVGFATAVPALSAQPSIRTGTATPIRGSEVFRLGSGVQIQQPGGPVRSSQRENENQNYILPTFSHDDQTQPGAASGEIYADIRLESGKKNLLTPHADQHDLYIEPGRQPEAEVIVYPMGQLLSNSNRQFLAGPDAMVMSGSSDDNVVMSQDVTRHRDQVPAFSYTGPDVSEGGTDQRKSAPNGLLETIIRTAKDDLDFAGNVLNFLTSSRSN